MLEALQALYSPACPFTVEVVDVDADPALVAKYDERVPVLFGQLDQPELCCFFLDEGVVRRYLAGPGHPQKT